MFYITTKAPAAFALLEAFTGARGAARARATELGGTVKTEAEYNKGLATTPAGTKTFGAQLGAQLGAKIGAYFTPDSPELAEHPIAKANKASWDAATKAKKTRKVKVAKTTTPRVETSAAVMSAGEKALAAAIKAELNKVGIVRAVAGVAGLQRRDVFAIIRSQNLEIADATISTQFQVTRSGKLK